MLTIERVSEALQEVLTVKARQAGRDSGFVQRQRKLDGASFTQTLVFGWMANPQASLEELAQAAATCGVEISGQGLAGRFTAAAAECLKRVLEISLTYALESDGSRSDIVGRFAGVYIQDSTVIGLPATLAHVWGGCGNQSGKSAGLKVQTLLEYQHGALRLSLHGACVHDCRLQSIDFPPGALRLADMGYFEVNYLIELSQQDVFWITRLPAKVCVWDEQGQKYTLVEWIEAHAVDGVLDGWVSLSAKGLSARLLAMRVPLEIAAERQAQFVADAQRRGQPVSPHSLALCHWSLCATNLHSHQLTLQEAFVLLRLRWQIELLFKLWKSQAAFTNWRSAQPWRILCEVYAKLIALVIQHWILLGACWDLPDRSLVKATQTLRKHAFHLAAVLSHSSHLIAALLSISQALSLCRVHKRKARPATFQRLASLSSP